MQARSIFSGVPENIPDELIEEFVRTDNVRIERIISYGHSSAEDFWYDQGENEWVLVLSGSACLLFEGSDEPVILRSGDWVDIPAHTKHRVEWTHPDEKTIWLAVFY